MKARELLRAAAERIDCGGGTVTDGDGCDMKPPCSEYAADLRALASRIEAEIATAKEPDRAAGACEILVHDARNALLARLDADLLVKPNPQQNARP
jgi:hypothetical protein